MQSNPYEAPVAEGGGAMGSVTTGRYEFSEHENRQIAETGRRAWMWGVVAILTGVIGLAALVVAFIFRADLAQSGMSANWVTIFIVGLFPLVAANILIAAFYMGAGNSLRSVVKTQGADVEHMIRAVAKLGSAFFIEFAVGTVALVGGFCLGVVLAVYTPEVETVEGEGGEEVVEEVEFDD